MNFISLCIYSYPVFVTCEACVLLRITVFDYQRVLQVITISASHSYPPSQVLLRVARENLGTRLSHNRWRIS